MTARLQILAHRGASAYAPENTRAAFDLGLALGANGLETDVRLTRDGVAVLLHDPSVDRMTDGAGAVGRLTEAEVRELNVPYRIAHGEAREPVMMLRPFLRRYGSHCHLALEIKAAEAAEETVAEVRRAGGFGTVTFTSFRYDTLALVHRLAPRARLGWLVQRVTPDVVAALREIDGRQVCPKVTGLRPAHVRLAGAVEVRPWGIRDTRLMRWALACGVAGMTIDFPDRLAGYLQRHDTRRIV